MDNRIDEQAIEQEMERAMAESMDQGMAAEPTAAPMAAQLEDLAGTMEGAGSAPISSLYGLSLPISIELGRTSMKVQEVLHLGRGSVIELDRLAGEPVDVFVGDRRFAEGEVVVLGENFGVRITRILPAAGGEIG
jgi:flagellar motor switch protein FliN